MCTSTYYHRISCGGFARPSLLVGFCACRFWYSPVIHHTCDLIATPTATRFQGASDGPKIFETKLFGQAMPRNMEQERHEAFDKVEKNDDDDISVFSPLFKLITLLSSITSFLDMILLPRFSARCKKFFWYYECFLMQVCRGW